MHNQVIIIVIEKFSLLFVLLFNILKLRKFYEELNIDFKRKLSSLKDQGKIKERQKKDQGKKKERARKGQEKL